MKRQWTPTSVKASCTIFCMLFWRNRSLHSFILPLAPTHLVVLSVKMVLLLPRRSINRFNALINAVVLRSPTNSMLTAFEEKQTKIHTHYFTYWPLRCIFLLIIKKPAKSIPQLKKVRVGSSRSAGRFHTIGCMTIGLQRNHITHSCINIILLSSDYISFI